MHLTLASSNQELYVVRAERADNPIGLRRLRQISRRPARRAYVDHELDIQPRREPHQRVHVRIDCTELQASDLRLLHLKSPLQVALRQVRIGWRSHAYAARRSAARTSSSVAHRAGVNARSRSRGLASASRIRSRSEATGTRVSPRVTASAPQSRSR